MLLCLFGLKKLKEQRNKLIKAFHPDVGNDDNTSAQKINEAYEVLKQALREG